jgi:PilX N-terminal
MTKPCARTRPDERGFALVLAILSLMLLTFLGLTLATTTSTELQIATNYRWSQQALYNAEAGLEAARIVLSGVADPTNGWEAQLPKSRTGQWLDGSAPGPDSADVPAGRDFEMEDCDTRGGVGYGKVLVDTATPPVDPSTTRYEAVSSFMNESLNGAFTIWVRRALDVAEDGQLSDSTHNENLVVVSEGVAPFVGPSTAVTRARQARRVLETSFSLALASEGSPCFGNLAGQEGLSGTGENFNPCAMVSAGALTTAFGGGGAGSLGDTGVE